MQLVQETACTQQDVYVSRIIKKQTDPWDTAKQVGDPVGHSATTSGTQLLQSVSSEQVQGFTSQSKRDRETLKNNRVVNIIKCRTNIKGA